MGMSMELGWMETNVLPLFTDSDGEPLRFFLPASLVERNAFKDKIEGNGGVLVQSELMTNIIKIGDPAKPQSYDASWLNFRYIDDALREGQLQNPEFYVMDNPQQIVTSLQHQHHLQQPQQDEQLMPVNQRSVASNGTHGGMGNRGARQEFTPEEDDVLRRIVHRPGVATSGNKIYQLIAQQYGSHSFHSWRDRYVRHMRPIWGPPTDEAAMAIDATDEYILTQSFLRAPHVGAGDRAGNGARSPSTPPDSMTQADSRKGSRATDTPTTIKKQRAAFSTTDDEILIRAIAESGETAQTYKALGQRHPHHTWESWKNRVKALKKRCGGVLPDYSQELSLAEFPGLDLTMGDHSSNLQMLQQSDSQAQHEHQQDLGDPNIDPNLHLQLSMMDDPNQQAFERQFQDEYHSTQDLDIQQQLHQDDVSASSFPFLSTEDILRQGLQGHTTDHGLELSSNLGLPQDMPARNGKRQIHIHDPTIDEDLGRVSEIEDASQTPRPKGRKGRKTTATKKRKTNAAARAAFERAAVLSKGSAAPSTPTRQIELDSPQHVKSAKLEHHERSRSSLVPAVQEDPTQNYLVDASDHRLGTSRARAASHEPQSSVQARGLIDPLWMEM